MKVIDARSGRVIRIGERIIYPDGEYIELVSVTPGLTQASARIRRCYPLRYHTGNFEDKGLFEDEVTTPLIVRWAHPNFLFQHVGFIPS